MADFAERLNKLFDSVHPPGRKPHTNAEVAAALIEDGHQISKPYISQLRSGQRTNPSDETVAAFARFFKVKPDYFFNDIYAAKIDHDLELLSQLQATASPPLEPCIRPLGRIAESTHHDG